MVSAIAMLKPGIFILKWIASITQNRFPIFAHTANLCHLPDRSCHSLKDKLSYMLHIIGALDQDKKLVVLRAGTYETVPFLCTLMDSWIF